MTRAPSYVNLSRLEKLEYRRALARLRSDDPPAPAGEAPAHRCELDVCRLAKSTGITCAGDECDIEMGVRELPASPAPLDPALNRLLAQLFLSGFHLGRTQGATTTAVAAATDPKVLKLRDCIHAEVQRRLAASRGEVVGTGVIISQWPHLNSVEVKLDEPESAMFRRWEGTLVTLTRSAP